MKTAEDTTKGRAMTKPTIELLPCPFCGGEAELESDDGATGAQHFVECCSHECIGFFRPYNTFATKSDAAKAWNTRAALAAQREG